MNYQWPSVVQFLSTLSPRTALIGKIVIGTPLSYYTLTLFKKLVIIVFLFFFFFFFFYFFLFVHNYILLI